MGATAVASSKPRRKIVSPSPGVHRSDPLLLVKRRSTILQIICDYWMAGLCGRKFWLCSLELKLTLKRNMGSRLIRFRAHATWCVQVLRSPKEAFAAAMQSWRERCEKCVCLQGDYVDKLLHFQLPAVSSFF